MVMDNKVLELKNVSFSYSKKTNREFKALNNISLEITDHEFLGIIGKAGSGKSTLIKILDGLLCPDTGELLWKGKIINGRKALTELRRHIGFVFQYPEQQLFKNSVIEDVKFGCLNQGLNDGEAEQAARQALQEVGLAPEYFTRSPFELSGGQMRKAAIAGIIAMRPEILILDEPTVGLDFQARQQLFQLLDCLYEKETSIVIVSHELDDVAAHCHKVCVIDDGKIVMRGTTEKVFNQSNQLKALGVGLPQITALSEQLTQELAIKKAAISYDQLLANIVSYLEGN